MAPSLSAAPRGRGIPGTELKPLPATAEQGAARSLACRYAVAIVCGNVFRDDTVARHRLVRIRDAVAVDIRRAPPAEQAAAARRRLRCDDVCPRAGRVERVAEHEADPEGEQRDVLLQVVDKAADVQVAGPCEHVPVEPAVARL